MNAAFLLTCFFEHVKNNQPLVAVTESEAAGLLVKRFSSAAG